MMDTQIKRLRFSVENDITLLKTVVTHEPYKNTKMWKVVHDSVCAATNKSYSLRAIKERIDYLIKLLQKDDINKLRCLGTMMQNDEKMKLLVVVHDMHEMYKNRFVKPRERKVINKDSVLLETINNNNTIGDGITNMEAEDTNDTRVKVEETVIFQDVPEISANRKRVSENSWDMDIRERELAIEEKRLCLEERKLKFEEEKFFAEKSHRDKRLTMEIEERKAHLNIIKGQQAIIDSLLKRTDNDSLVFKAERSTFEGI